MFSRLPSERFRQRIAISLGAFVAVIGALVIYGWFDDVDELKRIIPGDAPMKPITALGFILLGCSLWLTGRPDTRSEKARISLDQILVVGAGFIGLATLREYALDIRTGIDTWLFPDSAGAATASSMRMTKMAAINFILSGVALLSGKSGTRIRQGISLAGNLAVLSIALLALLGYLGGSWTPFSFPSSAGMSLHTALLFVVLALAGLLASHRRLEECRDTSWRSWP